MAGAGTARFDPDGRLRWVNARFRASFGAPLGGSLAQTLDALLAAGSLGDPQERNGAALADALGEGEHLRLLGPQGRTVVLVLSEDEGDGQILTVIAPLRTLDAAPAVGGLVAERDAHAWEASDSAVLLRQRTVTLEERIAERARELAHKQALLATAIESMTDAICGFDADLRLAVWNRRYADMFRLPESLLRAGTPFVDLARYVAGRGDDGPGEVEALVTSRVNGASRRDPFAYRYQRTDGSILDVRHSPLPGGGFVRSFTDLTDRARADEAQRQILQAISFPLLVTRPDDGLLLIANEPASELFGVALDGGGGTMIDLFVDPADHRRLLAELDAGGGRVDAFETRLTSAKGHDVWVLLSMRRFRFQGADGLLSCVNDITERKAMEQDLEAQWERSRAVLEGLSQGVMAFDRDLRLMAWNQRVLDLLDIEGGYCYFRQPLVEITRYVAERGGYGPGDVEQIIKDRLAYVLGPLPRRNERVRPDGLVMETLTQALPDGAFVTTYTDITDRKRAERELADSRELFELAIRAARDGISQWDVVNGTIWFSPQWWSLLGYGEDEMVNTIDRWSELILPEDRAASNRMAFDFVNGIVDECQIVQRYRHRQGHVVYLYTRAIKVCDAKGRTVKLVGSHTDITERIRADEAVRAAKEQAEAALRDLKDAQAHLIQSEKMAALGSMVAGVAHEVNTPVGNALTGASMLAERTKTIREAFDNGSLRKPDFAEYIETAQEATQLLLLNINRAAELIQSFKQMAVDQASGERRAFALRDYIQEVLRSLGVRLRRAAHTVTVDCPEELVMDGYPGAVSQVITNFVMNSIIHAYSPGQKGKLSIAVSAVGDDEIELRYADDGKGIAPELHQKVFEPFFTTNRGSGGSGLGLNIVYNIVTRTLKGRIALDSAPGQGAAFVLRFPRVVPDEPERVR